jgi:putative ABC transport system substrate-binding protein
MRLLSIDAARPSRRQLIGGGLLLVGGAAGWAQESGRLYRLAILVQPPRPQFDALFDELGHRGFTEGQNLIVDPRGFGTAVTALEATARELVELNPDAIYGGGDEAGRALQRATRTIPIAMLADDLLRAGLVASLAHPGGNITGVSIFAPELDGKRLEILVEILPGVSRIAVLVDPNTTAPDQLRTLAEVAGSRGIELLLHRAASREEIAPAIAAAQAEGAQAINVLASALFNAQRALIIEQVAGARLPAIYQWPEYARHGALVCYGPRLESLYRQVAVQLAKLLAGAKPADLPAQQPAKFDLTINLKTAKALGLVIPQLIVARADDVIE